MSYSGREINESFVLPEFRNDRYRQKYEELKIKLEDPNQVEYACVHEAGHVIFTRKAGFHQIEFHGPTMIYDDRIENEDDRYDYCIAAVADLRAANPEYYSEAVLCKLARIAIAGEVFNEIRQRYFTTIPADKRSDWRKFERECYKAHKSNTDIRYQPLRYWRGARTAVEAYLNNNPDEGMIQSTIAEVRLNCFDLR